MREQKQADADHLRLLAIFHFVGAGLAVLALGFLCLHFLLMHALLTHAGTWKNQRNGGMPPAGVLYFLQGIYFIAGAWLLASAVVNVLSGIFLTHRRYRTFSLVVAGMNCLHLPLGTVLGVFTLVVLLRPSVREAYEIAAAPGTPVVPEAPVPPAP